MQALILPARRGWRWLAAGFALFRRNPRGGGMQVELAHPRPTGQVVGRTGQRAEHAQVYVDKNDKTLGYVPCAIEVR